MRQRVTDISLAFLLFVSSLYLYLTIGEQFIAVTNKYKTGVLGCDSFAVTRVITHKSFSPKYHRTTAHPLFELFLRPIGLRMSKMLGRERTAMGLSAIAGSLGLVLFYVLLRKIKLTSLHAFLFSLLFGSSTPGLLYSSIPETYSFASTSLILVTLVYLFFDRVKTFLPAQIIASVVAVGVTTINLIWSVILFISKFRKRLSLSRQAILLLVFLLATGLIICALIVLQKRLYPHTKDFFTSQIYHSNIEFITDEFFQQPVDVITTRMPHFFVYNVAAPGRWRSHLRLGDLSDVKALTLFTLAAYILFLSVSIYLMIRMKIYRIEFFRALLVYLLFNACFYLFYGIQTHLYYSHYTFALIAVIAFPLSLRTELPKKFVISLTALLMLLVILVPLNNYFFLQNVMFD